MKASEFIFAQDSFYGEEKRVVIVTDNPSVGGRCRLPVTGVNLGFDWEIGDIIISVDEKILSEKHVQGADISKFIYSIGPETIEKIRGSKGDAEVRRLLKQEYLKQK